MRFILSAMGAIILKQMSDKDSFMFYEYEDLGGQYKRLKEQEDIKSRKGNSEAVSVRLVGKPAFRSILI